MATPFTHGAALSAALAAALLAAPAAARAAAAQCAEPGERAWSEPHQSKKKHGVHSSSGHLSHLDGSGAWTVKWFDGGCAIEMRAKGEVAFKADLSDVERMAPGASLELAERRGAELRAVEIRAKADGSCERKYLVNGHEEAFDDAAREWLGRAVLELDRRTGFAAETRVPKLLEQRGVDGVLREIAAISGDVAKGRYFAVLLKVGRPDAGATQTILRAAAREISSDVELGRVLAHAAKAGLVTDETADAYVEATGEIDSDVERGRALNTLLAGRASLTPKVALATLASAKGIDSDVELARFLVAAAKHGLVEGDETRAAFFEAVSSVDSDVERARVLTTLLKQPGLSRAVLLDIVRAASAIDSDVEMGRVLVAFARAYPAMDDELRAAYLGAAEQIESDVERRKVLAGMVVRSTF